MNDLTEAFRNDPPATRNCVDCGAAFCLLEGVPLSFQLHRCDSCQAVYAAKAEDEEAAQQARRYQTRAATLWATSGVPDDYRTVDLDGFSVKGVDGSVVEALHEVRQWVDTFDWNAPTKSKSLVLLGPVGTGKTHLIAAALRGAVDKMAPSKQQMLDRIREQRAFDLAVHGAEDIGDRAQRFAQRRGLAVEHSTVTFRVAPALLNELVEARFHQDGKPSEEQLYSQLIGTRILALDDLGRVARANQRDHQHEVWYRILGGRYNNHLPTLIATNCTLGELNAVLGDAVADRLMERADFLPMQGTSYRTKKRGA